MPRLFHAILAYSLGLMLLPLSHANIPPSSPHATVLATESQPDSQSHPRAATSHTAASARTDDHAITATFTLTNNTRITGEITSHTADTLTGSFGTYHWNELNYRDVWRIFRRLPPEDSASDDPAPDRSRRQESPQQDSAPHDSARDDPANDNPPDGTGTTATHHHPHITHWLALGRILLLLTPDQPDAEPWAERAFRRARHIASGADQQSHIDERIDTIRGELAALEHARREQKQATEQAQLRTKTPEADPWPATPWPALTRNEQRNAVLTIKADAHLALEQAEIDLDSLEHIEIARYLLDTDLPRSEAVRWATLLPDIDRELTLILHENPHRNPFWGKAAIFITIAPARFQRLEADAFGSFTPLADLGRSHPIGPKVFINLHHPGRRQLRAFEHAFVREVVRSNLHRHISPKRLPPWANDGIGEVIADRLFNDSPHLAQRRRAALTFVRTLDTASNLRDLLLLHYDDDNWPHRADEITAVGGLCVELLIREQPREFVHWINAVKQGEPWREALEAHMSITLDTLTETAVRYYRVND